MKIRVKKSEELLLTPQLFKEESNPPKFIFRTPTSSDMLKYLWTGDILQVLCDCFVRFENKIDLVDENDKAIEYNTYKEFINVGLSGEILIIHQECLTQITNKLQEMSLEADKVEKKSKSPMKSSKQDKETTLKD